MYYSYYLLIASSRSFFVQGRICPQPYDTALISFPISFIAFLDTPDFQSKVVVLVLQIFRFFFAAIIVFACSEADKK